MCCYNMAGKQPYLVCVYLFASHMHGYHQALHVGSLCHVIVSCCSVTFHVWYHFSQALFTRKGSHCQCNETLRRRVLTPVALVAYTEYITHTHTHTLSLQVVYTLFFPLWVTGVHSPVLQPHQSPEERLQQESHASSLEQDGIASLSWHLLTSALKRVPRKVSEAYINVKE